MGLWRLDAKGANHFFESFASELENGPHFANVLSRRDPHFAGGALEAQQKNTASLNARAQPALQSELENVPHFATVLSRRDPHLREVPSKYYKKCTHAARITA